MSSKHKCWCLIFLFYKKSSKLFRNTSQFVVMLHDCLWLPLHHMFRENYFIKLVFYKMTLYPFKYITLLINLNYVDINIQNRTTFCSCLFSLRRELWCMFKGKLQRTTIQMFNLLWLRSVRIMLRERCNHHQTHHRASHAVYINPSRLW